jgi:hypothetical protein
MLGSGAPGNSVQPPRVNYASGYLLRGCCSFSVRGRHKLRESLVFYQIYKLYTRVCTSTLIILIKDSRGSNTLNKASELYASKCELNVLLLSAAEPPVVGMYGIHYLA